MFRISPVTPEQTARAKRTKTPRNARMLHYSIHCPVCGKPADLGETVWVNPAGDAILTVEEAAQTLGAKQLNIGGNCRRKLGKSYYAKYGQAAA